MSNEIEITTKFCHPYMNFGGDGCNDVVLKVPQAEAVKLQTVEHSKGESGSSSEFIYHIDEFSFSFVLVLICYLCAKNIGIFISLFNK